MRKLLRIVWRILIFYLATGMARLRLGDVQGARERLKARSELAKFRPLDGGRAGVSGVSAGVAAG